MALSKPTAGNSFVSDLTYALSQEKATGNVIFSPFSIKSCLALAYLGAESTTANEIKTIVQLVGTNKEEIAQEFNQHLEKTKDSEIAKLKIANRIYVGEKYNLVPKFNELATKYFDSAAESIKFSDSIPAAKKINSWIEEKTNNKIKNLIDPSSLTADTAAVLINAIYFKGGWVNTFDDYLTKKGDFSVSATRKVQVDMMNQKDTFLYAELSDLNAIAVELPYSDTDLAMLIILPKDIDGLANLELKLKDIDIAKISDKFSEEEVRLSLPKFKIDFDIELNNVLKSLGLNLMFSNAADFSGLLDGGCDFKIDEVKHKAFIEVNEAGTEAAAATYAKVSLMCARLGPVVIYDFKADHPFFFAIKDKQNIYFAGHVTNF